MINRLPHSYSTEISRMKVHSIHVDGRQGAHGTNGQTRNSWHGRAGEHGEDAGRPSAGCGGGSVVLHLSSSTSVEGKIELVETRCTGSGGEEWAQTLQLLLDVDTTIDVRAKGGCGGRGGVGGNGGNGKRGSNGSNASRYFSAGHGGAGGNGGDAGHGSSGANGGKGGTIDWHMIDDDSYLLMAVLHAPAACVDGGKGGEKGCAGTPGKGGEGGRGGSSYSWTDGDGDRHRKSGGSKGRRGADGQRSKLHLANGMNGETGTFTIHVATGKTSEAFASRYDLRLHQLKVDSPERLHSSTSNIFQFGDTVRVINICVVNMGGMQSPVQPSEIRLLDSTRTMPDESDVAFVHRMKPNEPSQSPDELSFRVKIPDIRAMDDDMEPFRCQERLRLACRQLGPHCFERPYTNFNLNGELLEFRFPVENNRGFEGLPTIRAGDGMRIKVALTNTSLSDIGAHSASGRRVFVQFYRNPDSRKFDIASHHVHFEVEGIECNTKLNDSAAEAFRGTCLPIDHIAKGDTIELNGTLRLSSQVSPYISLAVQAEIVLQDLLPGEELGEPTYSPIQRRQLVVSTEPTYYPSSRNQIVLVTSSSTTKDQFVAWDTLFSSRLGLQVGYYSISIYGSLSPTFEPTSGISLAQAFQDKLVVILDDKFNPVGDIVSLMNPSCMLPNGCQAQSSGYDASTKWLLVGSSKEAIDQAQTSHFTAPPTDAGSFDSAKSFCQHFDEQLQKERAYGYVSDESIREDIIRVSPGINRSEKEAQAVLRYIKTKDALRQYIIVTDEQMRRDSKGASYKRVIVRRGYCRTRNSANVLEQQAAPTKNNPSCLLATLQSLSSATLIAVFVYAISRDDAELVDACLDTFTQALLWDLSNFLDGRFKVTDTIRMAFPIISELFVNEKMQELVADKSKQSHTAVSKLLARLECATRARDLNPWWWPISREHAVRRALREMVAGLKAKWSEAVLASVLETELNAIEDQVRAHLKKRYPCCTMSRLFGRWRKGLLYVCSHRNEAKYKSAHMAVSGTYRLIEMETNMHREKSRAIHPGKTFAKNRECNGMRQRAANQSKLAAQLLASIQTTRAQQEIRTEEEVEIAM